MKMTLVYLVVGLVAFGPVLAQAEDKDKAERRPSREEWREKMKNMTPEEREAKMKEWRARQGNAQGQAGEKFREEMKETAKQLGLDLEEMKTLSPEERQKKFREAVEKKNAELKEKKEKGTLTEEDKKLAAKLEEMKKRYEERRRQGGGGGSEGGKASERDARKPAIQDKK